MKKQERKFIMNQILDYLLDGALTLLVSTPVYIIIRLLIVRITGKKNRRRREMMLAVFWLFVIWLASETILPEFSLITDQTGRTRLMFSDSFHISAQQRIADEVMMNFVPFVTMRRYTSFADFGTSAVNLIGNVVMFVPLGFLLPLLWKTMRHFWKAAFLGLCSSCVIECIQLFIDRSVDIDDVILNTAGVIVGYILVQLLFRLSCETRSIYLKK